MLCDFYLISNKRETFDIHGLVQLATRDWLKMQGQFSEWRKKFIMRIFKFFPDDYKIEHWPICNILLPHADAMVSHEPGTDSMAKTWIGNLDAAGAYATNNGLAAIAEHILRPALIRSQQVFGPNEAATMNIELLLGLALQMQRKHDEVDLLDQKILASEAEILAGGSNNPHALYHLAASLHRQGQFEEAVIHLQRALDICEKSNGPKHDSTLSFCHQLGKTLAAQGSEQYPEAETMLRRVFEGVMETQRDNFLSTVQVTRSLGNLWRERGQLEEPESLLRKVVLYDKKLLSPSSPMRLHGLAALGTTMFAQENFEAPSEELTKAWEQIPYWGNDHDIAIYIVSKIAVSNLMVGNFGEMWKFWAKTQDCVKKVPSNEVQGWKELCDILEARIAEIEAQQSIDETAQLASLAASDEFNQGSS